MSEIIETPDRELRRSNGHPDSESRQPPSRQKWPSTMAWCPECDEFILRSRRFDHEHEVWLTDGTWENESRRVDAINVDEGIRTTPLKQVYDEDDDKPMEVGGEYRVEISYSVTHTSTVVARNENQAKEMARDEMEFGTFHDGHQTWTEVSKTNTIYEDDDEADEHDLNP